ncbi:hypothetical protein OMW55_08235 [Sphingomonas sp. BN140010]|uniref:Protein TonB n=1 Tax=Sphingomonas arvum TaxID=2992113 RepID=A0ABT3JFD4_9SPHN|nr:hypothetical protein [Sphingomonas sp. BN140010]MCW3797790.1 hypothetical protein [Sphingomonas sp. BN140010]
MSSVADTFRIPARRRAAGLAAAFAIEALLVLALLTLGRERTAGRTEQPRVVSFELSPDKTPEQPTPPKAQEQAAPSEPQPTPTKPQPPLPGEPVRVTRPIQPVSPAPLPPLVELPRGAVPSIDLRSLPSAPAAPAKPRRAAGPPSDSRDVDTPVVGTAPNGERLYAASWYREPYDDELRGYLSTADGPGWALIACKTVPDFRVDDCVALDEYPANSRMARAVLAAAWQFRVRPPQLGGQLKVGEWVRIRIDYSLRRSG